jgi:peptide-methionine (R)-S-oxide reductase
MTRTPGALHHRGKGFAPDTLGRSRRVLKRGFVYVAAAAITLTAWLVGFRPGPGGAERLLTVHAASPEGGGSGQETTVWLYSSEKGGLVLTEKVTKTKEEWKAELSPLQYRVLREKGTERPFTGALLENKEHGVYVCAACGTELFSSDAKFESGTGWPSFYAPIAKENVATERDNALGMRRIEVLCSRCGGHLGHVFDDGPKPTGLRYCVNSASLGFEKK